MTWRLRQRRAFGRLEAISQGQGPTLLMLHGVGLRAEAWNRQIDALSPNFSIIAPDMAGHGESAALDRVEPGLADFADLAAEALEGEVFVTGHSMGALIALDLAVRYPEKVVAVAALNAIFERSAEASAAVRARAEALSDALEVEPEPTLRRWFGDGYRDEAQACREWLTNVPLNGYRSAYRVFARENGPSRKDLRRLGCPALFATGGREPNSTPAMSAAMAELAPAGQSVIIEDAAHMMPMTHPGETNELLLQFFGGVGR